MPHPPSIPTPHDDLGQTLMRPASYDTRRGPRKRALAAGAALLASFAVLESRRAQRLDRRAGAALSRPLGDSGDTVISAGTDLGSVYAICGLAAALTLAGRRRAAADVAGAGVLGWVAAQGLKPLVSRPRPYQADAVDRLVVEPSGASWPSGHVAVAAGMAGALSPRLPTGGKVVAAVGSVLVAYSRVYVGVHYLSDVVAGMGLGVLSAEGWRSIRRRITDWLARRT
ncbi:MAG: phosphatase PAP2 family protein [Nitriliruptorales bacterium]|nr:phosphatase PAP2 family protein [Nitriliruptorales bacterium]